MSRWGGYLSKAKKSVKKTVSSTASSVQLKLNKAASEALKQAQSVRRQMSRYIPSSVKMAAQLKEWQPFLRELAAIRKRLSSSSATTKEFVQLLKKVLPKQYLGAGTLKGMSAQREIENFLKRKGIDLNALTRLARRVGIRGNILLVIGITGEGKALAGVDLGAGIGMRLDSTNREYSWYVFGDAAAGATGEATAGVQIGVYFRTPQDVPGPYLAIEGGAVISGVGLIGGEVNAIFDFKGLSGVILGYTPGFGGGINGAVGVLVLRRI